MQHSRRPLAGSRFSAQPVSRADLRSRFEIDPHVAQRFNAYAAFAYPNEIGGLLRIEQPEPGVFRATDLKIFEQKVTGAYFELDPMALSMFTMQLLNEGRGNEIEQWKSLIHSHPSMTPQMSGTDRENIELLAGQSFAFSVICSAQPDPTRNYYATHYCQAQPAKLIVHNVPVHTDTGARLDGVTLVGDEELVDIQRDVSRLCTTMTTAQSLRAPAPPSDTDDVGACRVDRFDAAFYDASDFGDEDDDAAELDDEDGFATEDFSDGEYEICDSALALLEAESRSGYQQDEIDEVRSLIDGGLALSDEDCFLLADALDVFLRRGESSTEEQDAAEALRGAIEDHALWNAKDASSARSRASSRPVALSPARRAPDVSWRDLDDFAQRKASCEAARDEAQAARANGDEDRARALSELSDALGAMLELTAEQNTLLGEVKARMQPAQAQLTTAGTVPDARGVVKPAGESGEVTAEQARQWTAQLIDETLRRQGSDSPGAAILYATKHTLQHEQPFSAVQRLAIEQLVELRTDEAVSRGDLAAKSKLRAISDLLNDPAVS